jgi:hypothetical protein
VNERHGESPEGSDVSQVHGWLDRYRFDFSANCKHAHQTQLLAGSARQETWDARNLS